MRVALDFDAVLADSHSVMLRESDMVQSDFITWEKDDHDGFMEIMERVWDEVGTDIPPMEENIGILVGQLHVDHEVDIVTHTLADDETLRAWLSKHDVPYNEIVHDLDTPKEEYDYDVYIDDKPELVGKVDLLYLRDRPWNSTVDTVGRDDVYRIQSLRGAINGMARDD